MNNDSNYNEEKGGENHPPRQGKYISDNESDEEGGENCTPPQGEYISESENLAEKLRRDFLIQSPAGRIQLDYEAELREAIKETTIDEVSKTLSYTIKEDEDNKKVLFLKCLLNYTDRDQDNIAFNAPSSTGKTYIALEILEFFPDEDKELTAYCSPKAFYHEMSELCTLDGERLPTRNQYVADGLDEWVENHPKPEKGKGVKRWNEERRVEKIRLKNEWDAIEKVYRVDLRKKFLVFMDMPHDKLLQTLRPLLSHDKKVLKVKITDKSKSGGNRTKHIWLVGFPTVIFLSANLHYDEQERTRLTILSPEMSQNKYRKSLELQTQLLSNRREYRNNLENNRRRSLLKRRVRAIKEANISEIFIRERDSKKILKRFKENHSTLVPRHLRDFPRLISLIKAHALLNCFTREKAEDGEAIYVNEIDIDKGFELAEKITKSNELGLPPYLYDFYDDALKPTLDEEAPDGITRREYSSLYFDAMNHRLGEKAMRNQIRLLEDAGLIIEEYDPDNRRRKKIYIPRGGVQHSPPQIEKANVSKEKSARQNNRTLDTLDGLDAKLGDAPNGIFEAAEGFVGLETRIFYEKMKEEGYDHKQVHDIVFNSGGFYVDQANIVRKAVE